MPSENQSLTPLASPRRRRWPIVLLVLVIFICGLIAGSGLSMYLLWHHFLTGFNQPEKMTERITNRLTRRLDLTEDQARAVREIIRRKQETFRSIRREVQPRITAELDEARQEIEALLTPEQARKFKDHYEKIHRHWLKFGR